MLALTIRQPWAWAIVHAGKDVENRQWPTRHRGPLVIHAGARHDDTAEPLLAALGVRVPDQLQYGVAIGIVDVIDCTVDLTGPWSDERYRWHWLLANPRAIEHVPVRGQPGLFVAPATIADNLTDPARKLA